MKKTFAAFTLALVTVFGATFAHAGILVSDAPDGIIVGDGKGDTCKDGIIVSDAPGIIVSDAPGIIVSDIVGTITGIIVSDGIIVGDDRCTEKDGIIVGD